MALRARARQCVDSIQREDLFSLDIGPMEDQIALYNFEGDGEIRQADLAKAAPGDSYPFKNT